MRWIASVASIGAVALLLGGCGSNGDDQNARTNSLDDAENVKVWATTASALAIWSNVHDPFAASDGEPAYEDPACPAISDDGTRLSIVGGCVDTTGTQWLGTATVVRSPNGDRELTIEDFGGFDDPSWHVAIRGTVSLRRIGEDLHAFDASLVHGGGMTTTVEYSGTIAGGYAGPTLWNGAGLVERDGLLPPRGLVTAATVDQLVDDSVCSGQPLSGQTTIDDGKQVAVVTYDGATDCDDDQAARWSIDGEDRGLVEGVNCALTPAHRAGAGSAPWWVPFGALAVAARLMRRRRSARGRRGDLRRLGTGENR